MVESKSASMVRLELHASKLKNVAGAFQGTSDPYAVVTLLANDPRQQPRVLGKTEVIKNSLNPQWTTHFDIEYELGRETRINVGVYDEVLKGNHKPMGSAMFEVGEVLGSRGNIKAKHLRNAGTLFARIRPAPAEPQGVLHLTLHGVQLKNVDGMFGRSDPFFELSAKVESGGMLTWQPVYRSKEVMNDMNPKWEPFSVDLSRLCEGDLKRPVMVKVYNWQKNGKHQVMGSFETTVDGFMAAQVGVGTGGRVDTSKAFSALKRGKLMGGQVVVVSARVVGAAYSKPVYTTQSDQSAKPVPSIPASVYGSSTGFAHGTTVHSIPPPASPTTASDIPPFSMALDLPPPSFSAAATAAVATQAFSSFSSIPPQSAPAPAGAFSSSVAAVSSRPSVPEEERVSYSSLEPLPPPTAPPNLGGSMVTPMAKPVSLEPAHTYVDYLSGGCELELCIAIDFTGSNGDPRRPGTLHYIHPDGQLNDYEKAITAIGSILAKYDHDQKFPVWGFGAKYGGVIQHCFQVGPKPELDGIPSVIEAYRSVFRTGLTMSGPTVFAEVIGLAAAEARSQQEAFQRIGKQAYKVLLILTDGAVSDVDLTKHALDAASDAPLSVVIVGIGGADFSAMQFLDDFQTNGRISRDICQFVEFSKYQHDRSALTRATLAEIPDQLVGYFKSRGIRPLPPISGSQMSLDIAEPSDADIDLNLNFGEDGEISLANYNGAVYDDTAYGTTSSYVPSAPYQPSSAPYQTTSYTSPYVPQAPAAYQPQTYQASGSNAYQPSNYRPQQPISSTYVPSQPVAPAPAPANPIFQVQAPPGSYPGMQLQIKNPYTGQAMMVAVPQGVAPGGIFAVRY